MLQLFGTYYHRVDDKGRVALPIKFHKVYERGVINGDIKNVDLVVTPSPAKADDGTRQCLYVFTADDFDRYVNSLFEVVGGYNPRNKDHERQMRALHADVESVSIDSARRINIPQKFLNMAGLKKDVAIVGNAGHFEIWDEKRLKSELSDIDLDSLIYE